MILFQSEKNSTHPVKGNLLFRNPWDSFLVGIILKARFKQTVGVSEKTQEFPGRTTSYFSVWEIMVLTREMNVQRFKITTI